MAACLPFAIPLMWEGPATSYSSCLGMEIHVKCQQLPNKSQQMGWAAAPWPQLLNGKQPGPQWESHAYSTMEEDVGDAHFHMSDLYKNCKFDRPGKVFRYTGLIWHFKTIMGSWRTTKHDFPHPHHYKASRDVWVGLQVKRPSAIFTHVITRTSWATQKCHHFPRQFLIYNLKLINWTETTGF